MASKGFRPNWPCLVPWAVEACWNLIFVPYIKDDEPPNSPNKHRQTIDVFRARPTSIKSRSHTNGI